MSIPRWNGGKVFLKVEHCLCGNIRKKCNESWHGLSNHRKESYIGQVFILTKFDFDAVSVHIGSILLNFPWKPSYLWVVAIKFKILLLSTFLIFYMYFLFEYCIPNCPIWICFFSFHFHYIYLLTIKNTSKLSYTTMLHFMVNKCGRTRFLNWSTT